MTISRAERVPEYTERDVILVTSLVSGHTVKEAGEAAGIGERRTYEILQRDEHIHKRLRAVIEPLVKVNKREVERIAIENAQKAFEERLGLAMSALDEALSDPTKGLDAAKEVFNRIFGKAAATLHVKGGVRHEHVAVIPAETLAALNAAVAMSGNLYNGARALSASKQALIDVTPG